MDNAPKVKKNIAEALTNLNTIFSPNTTHPSFDDLKY